MGNLYRAEAELVAGETTYRLQLDSNAVAHMEEAFDVRGKFSVFSIALNGSIFSNRAFLHACLQRHHPAVTLRAAGELLDDQDVFERIDTLAPKLIEDYFPPLRGKLLPTATTPQTPPEKTPTTAAAI